jgi:hypothetical protein
VQGHDREDEKEAADMTALRALLGGIVDYAGLFPPAALDMATAVRNYATYRREPQAWMLGRFVVPVARLREFLDARAGSPDRGDAAWPLSALLGADPVADVAAAHAFNRSHGDLAVIDSLEGKLSTPDEIERVARAAGAGVSLFVELPADRDPKELIAAVHRVGAHGKIRTGGVTAAAIPNATEVVRFIRACLDAGVSFKATAGLHHPIRAEYRLTYDASSPTGVMFGYLNVFLASALLAQGATDAEAACLLEERDPHAFGIGDDAIEWRGHVVRAAQAASVRERVALSFGSCSFREPVDELQMLVTA